MGLVACSPAVRCTSSSGVCDARVGRLPSRAVRAWLQASLLGALVLSRGTEGSGGLMDSERLFESDGSWHRGQRNRVSFETACYYTHETELPYGCQRSKVASPEWSEETFRASEKASLMDLYKATGGAEWRANDNWGYATDPCWDFWYGVTCDEHGHVIALELSDNRLKGELPSSMRSLRHLLKLDLSSTAPSYHTHANEDVNVLTGALPPFPRTSRLAEIEISGNQIEELPLQLWLNWPTLRVLSASDNLLTAFPANLGAFTQLHTLELSNNRISENFTEVSQLFGNLAEARYVHLSNNQLYGGVTSEIIGMTKIQVFDVSHNPQLSGEVPQKIIEEWPEAEYISILNTSIVGYHSSLCIDQPYCWKFMYSTHADMTWAMADNVTDNIYDTIALAASR